jgi:hypothetical protein
MLQMRQFEKWQQRKWQQSWQQRWQQSGINGIASVATFFGNENFIGYRGSVRNLWQRWQRGNKTDGQLFEKGNTWHRSRAHLPELVNRLPALSFRHEAYVAQSMHLIDDPSDRSQSWRLYFAEFLQKTVHLGPSRGAQSTRR